MLTHFEICLKLAELKGLLVYEQFESVRVNVVDGDDYYFDPIADDALCHQLMIEFGVTFHPKQEHVRDLPYARCGSHKPIHDASPNRAICMAIIAGHMDPDVC